MDDEISRDHHWGLRVDMMMPEEIFRLRSREILKRVGEGLPETFQGFALREGHVEGAGIAPESLEGFLQRTIGLTDAPKDFREWLDMPEEDIVHVTNGEVWYDPSGRFTRIRSGCGGFPTGVAISPEWVCMRSSER